MSHRVLSRREMWFALAAGIVAIAVCYFMPGASALVAEVEYRTVDWRFRIRGPRPSGRDVVIVGIDEDSLAVYGRWPWPRRVVARLLEQVEKARPRVVAFDVLFAEPSTPTDDAALEQAIARYGNAVLALFVSSTDVPEWFFELPQIRAWQRVAAGQSAGDGVYRAAGLDVPMRRFARAAAALGAAEVVGSADGVYREAPLMIRCGAHLVPSLPLAVTCAARGIQPAAVQFVPGRMLRLGGAEFPVDVYGLTPIDFAGPTGTFPYVSARAVLAGEKQALDALRGKIVLIGATAYGLFDLRPSPYDPQFRGVEALANVVDNLLTGRTLRPTPGPRALLVCLLLAIAVAAQIGLLRAEWGWLTTLVLVGGYAELAIKAFSGRGIVLPVAGPVIVAAATMMAGLVARLGTVERQRRRAVTVFSRFVPPEIARELVDEDADAAHRGERRVVTVMFADIRHSTAYAQRLTPEELVEALNKFFEEGHAVVWRHGGTLDKFIGDAILAFFNAPQEQEDHVLRAVRAALELVNVIKLHADTWEFHGLPGLSVGVGIATGEAVVGFVGSQQRMQYTVIGPTVHLAARLEELAKRLGADVIISEAAYREVADQIEARDRGEHLLHGFEEPVRVYEVLSIKADSGGAT